MVRQYLCITNAFILTESNNAHILLELEKMSFFNSIHTRNYVSDGIFVTLLLLQLIRVSCSIP